eukprot:CAMPEP_0202452642 /NCGR_PEP_ID=MMETSP1360-20130828/10801_1 /ASSEMBLY_ACC=CAM_ASM_000848 /TAXON_ID=515479 /ORGANISM="Licmophora paradoxa, Strain CCMP2313" /LENGTH=335 /DNA_ID=CAMNT_0049071511 /DNA_START=84 /DNA_END=1091 /DNA_ORIENTATION=-
MSSDSLTPIIITHSKSSARAVVYPFGASVTSYQTSTGRELLFVSSAAKLDGSKAIRGGIPVVFPQFGTSLGFPQMPSHGFARINTWKVIPTVNADVNADTQIPYYDNEHSAGITLQLTYNQDVKNGRWASPDDTTSQNCYDCVCTYHIDVKPQQLTTTLTITNTGQTDLPYQALFHTYLRIQKDQADDPKQCFVKGLDGNYQCQNNMVEGKPIYTQTHEHPVIVEGETEKVFTPIPQKQEEQTNNELDVTVATGDGTFVRVLTATTTDTTKNDSSVSPASCVVWNPHLSDKAKQMTDFDENEYTKMLCVEPGWIGTNQILAKGQSCALTQILKAE